MSASPPPCRNAAIDLRFAVFCSSFAVAVIIYHVEQHQWQGVANIIELTAAGLTAVPNTRTAGLSMLIPAVIANSVVALPDINTNRLVQLFIAGAVAAAWVVMACRSVANRGRGTIEVTLAGLAIPVLRIIVIMCYAFAAWHKLNSDFLNPVTSCGPALYQSFADALHRKSSWLTLPRGVGIDAMIIGATLSTESLLPILLCVRRVRARVVVVALVFHYLLGLSLFLGFSSTMIALLMLFMPEAWFRAAEPRARAVRPALIVLSLLATLIVIGSHWPSLVYRACWVAWLAAAPLAYRWLRARWSVADAQGLSWKTHPALAAIPLLFAFNAASPYLGAKTEGSLAMYSNLRTEGGSTNHLLLPRPLAVFRYQTDLVRVLGSSDPQLDAIAKRGYPIPWIALRIIVDAQRRARTPIHAIVYTRADHTFDVRDVATDAELSQPPTFLERTLLRFRDILPRDANACSH